jgi:hypothetical protein
MLKKFAAISILILISSAESCFDRLEDDVNSPCYSNCIEIIGQLVEGYEMNPIGGVPLELGWEEININVYNPGRLIGSLKSASDGSFHFSFSPNPEELQRGVFYIESPETNERIHLRVDFRNIQSSDTVINVKYKVPSKATLLIKLKDFNLSEPSNAWTLSGHFNDIETCQRIQLEEIDKSASYSRFMAKNEFDSHLLFTVTSGDDYTYFESVRIKNGVETIALDTIYLEAGEHNELTLEF